MSQHSDAPVDGATNRRWKRVLSYPSRLAAAADGTTRTALAVLLVGTLARYPLVLRPLTAGKPFRETQTAFTIREFARHGLHLLHPSLPIFGPPWAVPMEFPLFQAAAAVLARAGLSTAVAGRLTGLLCFELTGLLLYLLVRRIASARAALITLLLFQAVPYSVFFSTACLIEFLATAFSVGAVLATWRWLDGASWPWLLVAAAASAGAFLVKLTTALGWMVPIAVLGLIALKVDWRGRWRRVAWGWLAGVGVGVAFGAWWTHYADAEKLRNPYATFLTSHNLLTWNFGTLKQRSTVLKQEQVLEWITGLVTGWWPLLLLFVVLICIARSNRAMKVSLLLVPVVAIETFFNLFHHNDYYLSAVLPALVAVAGIGIDEAATRLHGLKAMLHVRTVAAVGVVLVLLGTWLSGPGLSVARQIDAHPKIPGASVFLSRLTPPDANILGIGCEWSPVYFYFADRRGLMYDRRPMQLRIAGRTGPALTAPYVLAHFRYVWICDHPRRIAEIPRTVELKPIAHRLFEIIGRASAGQHPAG